VARFARQREDCALFRRSAWLASNWFRSAKTGASSSRECSSCEGVGSFGVHVDHEANRQAWKINHNMLMLAS